LYYGSVYLIFTHSVIFGINIEKQGNKNMKVWHFTLCVLALSSCNHGIKQNLGLLRETPDEFKVISQPDLTMPPDFDLVPPQYPVESYKFNATLPNHNDIKGLSKEEEKFLQEIAIAKKDENIRNVIFMEQKHVDYTTDGTVTKRLDNVLHPEKSKTKVLDPVAENKRIQKNIKENKPITEGEVESVNKEKSVIDKILGN